MSSVPNPVSGQNPPTSIPVGNPVNAGGAIPNSNATGSTATAPKKIAKKAAASRPRYKKNYIKPDKWWQTYSSDEEKKFFVALCRGDKTFTYRSVAAIAKETKITEKRIEEIIDKYMQRGMVFQSPKNPDLYGYWELNEELLDEDVGTIAEEDQKDRVSKAMP